MMNVFVAPHAQLRPRQATAIGVASLILVGISGAGAVAAETVSAAGTSDSYEMNIAARGIAIDIYDPNLVLQPNVSVGPYAALATLDSLGRSTAQAGAPDLGSYVGPLFGQLNGLGSGQIPPFPPFPGEVRSSYPEQPSAAQRNGGYSVEAASGENQSAAAVGLGSAAPGSENARLFSVARALAGRSGLKAVGSAGATLLNIGGVLDIGRVASTITMSQSGSRAPKFVTSTDVGTITVSGQKFGLNQDGLTAAGTNSPVSASQVNDATAALHQAGISIRYVPATVTRLPGTQTVESVQSGAVEVAYQSEVPSQGLVTNTYTLGLVQVSAKTRNFAVTNAPEPAAAAGSVAGGTSAANTGVLPRSSRAAAPDRTPAGHALKVSASSLGTAPGAQANPRSPAAEEPSAAIITPTLKTLRFGSTIGLPDGCNIFFGALGAGAAELGGGDAGSALSNGVDGCTALGNSGGEQLTAAIAQTAPLTAINPAVNPGIDAFADALESVGRDQAQFVAPFGPTIVGFATDARYFKGCEPC